MFMVFMLSGFLLLAIGLGYHKEYSVYLSEGGMAIQGTNSGSNINWASKGTREGRVCKGQDQQSCSH